MLSHLKYMTCLGKSPAKFYILETQTAAVMQQPSFQDVTPPYPSFPMAYAAQLSQNGMSIGFKGLCASNFRA